MKKFYAFTLAEVLITMTLIGVVAALSIPSVTTGIKEKGLEAQTKKAPQSINNAILANIGQGRKSPLDFRVNSTSTEEGNSTFSIENATLFADYLAQNLDVVDAYDSAEFSESRTFCLKDGVCYTVIGNRDGALELITQPERNNEAEQGTNNAEEIDLQIGHCGTRGLNIGGSRQARAQNPCLILVDVNGDKTPNKLLKNNDPEKGISDRFILYITDSGAIIDPYNKKIQRVFGN